MARQSNRVKIFQADKHLVLDILSGIAKCEIVSLPEMPEIPSDAELEDIHYSHERRAWLLLVSHPSYEEVPPGWQVKVSNGLDFGRQAFIRKPLSDTHDTDLPSPPAGETWRDQAPLL